MESEPSSTNRWMLTPLAKAKGCVVCGRPGHAANDCKLNQGNGKGQSKGKSKSSTTDKNCPVKFEGECRRSCGGTEARRETQGMRLEREARDLAAAWQSSRQLGQPLGEGGL